jgi:NAD(P)-dependent dehydrogenase (short-subunit alcohol dehydrogenase family)
VGPLDVLVNSAGIGKPHPGIEDITLEQWNETIDINLLVFPRA